MNESNKNEEFKYVRVTLESIFKFYKMSKIVEQDKNKFNTLLQKFGKFL